MVVDVLEDEEWFGWMSFETSLVAMQGSGLEENVRRRFFCGCRTSLVTM